MNCFIFIGPPGAGKGTQSMLLYERLGFTHVSTGMIIRSEIASQSSLGKSVKDIVEAGSLVDDKTIVQCLVNHIDKLDDRKKDVILLDGIPRNLNQLDALDRLFGTKLRGVVALQANPDDLVQRFSKRWHCKNCGRVESLDQPPPSDYICASCHNLNSFIRRKDDDPEIITSRFKIYHEQTFELLNLYRKREMLYEFDALESSEVTYVNIASLILQKICRKC